MKRLLAPAALVAASLVFAILCFEIVLRAVGFSAPIWYNPHAHLGWTLRPGLAAWSNAEGRAFIEINRAGFRDQEHALAKPPNVYRVAVLGDSYSEAFHVPREQTFWALLPERLERCGIAPGKRIEVLNFGVSGYGTAQEYLMLEAHAVRYAPDFVLLQFTNGNDVRNNSAVLEHEDNRPFFVFDGDGALKLDDSFASSPWFRRRSSPAWQWLRVANDYSRVLQLLRAMREARLVAHSKARVESAIEHGLDAEVLAAPATAAWQEAWRLTERVIAKTAGLAAKNGARFAIVTVPYAAQVHPQRSLREALAAKLGVPDLFYPDRRIGEFAKRNSIQAVLLAPPMQRLAEERGIYFHGFENVGVGHWNAQGHRAAADLIARELCPGRRTRDEGGA